MSNSANDVKRMKSGGGLRAIRYVFKTARKSGGIWKMWRALGTKNACKTCALGMGGQKGGMVNEAGHWPEFCKKSVQAMAADMQGAIQPEFWKTYSISQMRRFDPKELEHCGRLVQPVLLQPGSDHYQPIEWSEAYDRIAAKLAEVQPDESFWYFSGRSSNEAGFLLQLSARLFGTNNVNNCSYYCHQASGVGLNRSLGTGTATISLEDLEKADTLFLIGGNPASNHPRLMTTMMKLRRRGGKVIVINPVVETGLVRFRVPSDPRSLLFGSEIASRYVQPHIGGDLALLYGMAKRVIELDAHDAEFLEQYCEGADEWLKHLQALSWDEIESKSGVSKSEIDALAQDYASSQATVFSWTMGITHHAHGVDNVEAISALAMLRGMVGRPNAGLMPIRGHSNVQGIGTVGVTPKLKDEVFRRIESELGFSLPQQAGLDTMACMEQAAEGKIRFGFCLGGNLYGSNPDSEFAAHAMQNLEMAVYMSTTLNTGHAHGTGKETIILPVLARDEEPEPTTQESMFNYVRLSDGGKSRLTGPRSEIEIIAEISQRMLGESSPIDWSQWTKAKNIRKAISLAVPGMEKLAEIDDTKEEFTISGRRLSEPKFPTASGKGIIRIHELPELKVGQSRKGAGEPLTLSVMTVRSEGQFNTVVYENEDIYRGQVHRDVILVNPEDIRSAGLEHNQLVDIVSDTGKMNRITLRAYEDIRAGNALMYYPEANVLVPRSTDPKSKTPAFKGVQVQVTSSDR